MFRTDNPSAVAFENVTKHYGDTIALGGVSIDIPIGQTVALLGPNGAGKSTAINLMLGLLNPTSGSIRTLGLQPRDAIAAGRVGALLQTSGLPVTARVGELVAFVRRLYPQPLPTASILDRSGLRELEGRPVETLSGGEAQRLRFAMAIAGDPDLVFLDEPTVGMDVETRRSFWTDIRAFAAEGRTVLFATHYLDEADDAAERIVVLSHGRVVADGSARSIKAQVSDRVVSFNAPGGAARRHRRDRSDARRLGSRSRRRSVCRGHDRLRRRHPAAVRGRSRYPRPRDQGRGAGGRVHRPDLGRRSGGLTH